MSLSSADRYDRDVLSINQTMLMDRIPQGASVLELGASTGYMSAAMREAGSYVVAVERDREALTSLATRSDEAYFGDLEDPATLSYLDDRTFDVIVLADVLEHLCEPASTLARCDAWLNPGGQVLVTMPNVAFWRVRVALARGQWEMTKTGILDETHLRFFTLSTAERMFDQAGFNVAERQSVFGGMPLDDRFLQLRLLWPLKDKVNNFLKHRAPQPWAFQYFWDLRPSDEPRSAGA